METSKSHTLKVGLNNSKLNPRPALTSFKSKYQKKKKKKNQAESKQIACQNKIQCSLKEI